MRITVELSKDDFDSLKALASEEIRDPRSQAAYILRNALKQRSTVATPKEYVLAQDDSCHWYVVAANDLEEFYRQNESEEFDFSGLDVEEINGHPNKVKFTAYRID